MDNVDLTNAECTALMCRIPIFGFVTQMCRQLLLQLRQHIGYGKDAKVYNDAIFDMLIRDPMNIERFILSDFREIRFSDHVGKRGKDGKMKKLISCRADFIQQ